MKSWIDTYPHRIYASVLLFKDKIIDYKIAQNYWEDVYHISLRGQISIKDLFRSRVLYTSWDVNSEEEHNEVFDKLAKEWIRNQNS